MSDKLLPCPFCGDKATPIQDARFAYVQCDGCNAITAGWTNGKPRPDTAKKAWNTRQQPRCDDCKYLDTTGLCSELYAKYFEYNSDLYSEDYRQVCFHVRPEKDFYCKLFERKQ